MNKIFLLILVSSIFVLSCNQREKEKDPLKIALNSDDPAIRRVMDSLDAYEVQILYSQIDRTTDTVIFTDYEFQVNAKDYFYPASTVKFPIAVLALEKLNQTDTLDRNVKYYIEGDSIENTFAQDISKVFAVSDNHANNRLLEYQGQDAINSRLEEKGLSPVRISHRLGIHSTDLSTKPLILYINDSTTSSSHSIHNTEAQRLELNRIEKGIGYYIEDSLYSEPFDFSLKNYYPLTTQHNVLKRVVFPNLFLKSERFEISEEQRGFLLESMHTLPRNAGYDPEEYYDGYCKFFIYGDSHDKIPDNIKIYNKVGFAYGTLTDCAYITDTENNIEFLLTATILVNKDGIFNDDNYEYDEIGIPFLAALGKEVYAIELERK